MRWRIEVGPSNLGVGDGRLGEEIMLLDAVMQCVMHWNKNSFTFERYQEKRKSEQERRERGMSLYILIAADAELQPISMALGHEAHSRRSALWLKIRSGASFFATEEAGFGCFFCFHSAQDQQRVLRADILGVHLWTGERSCYPQAAPERVSDMNRRMECVQAA